jgi:hypothetical protein
VPEDELTGAAEPDDTEVTKVDGVDAADVIDVPKPPLKCQ